MLRLNKLQIVIVCFGLSAQGLLLAGCSLDASIANMNLATEADNLKQAKNGQIEMSHTEMVSTISGYKIQGTWNEISQKKKLANGYQVEGVFYE